MKITELRDKALKKEKGCKEINVADASEFLRVINKVTKGEFYKWVKKIK